MVNRALTTFIRPALKDDVTQAGSSEITDVHIIADNLRL